MRKPKTKSNKIIHQNPYGRVSRVTMDFGKRQKDFYVAEFDERVGIVVIRNNMVLLVRQYRVLINRDSWEIPGGGVKPGETPAKAIVRECYEETGVRCKNIKPLLFYQETLESVHTPTHLFHATDFTEDKDFSPDPEEIFEKRWFSFRQCLSMIKKGEMLDSFTILALLAYQALISKKS
ncbi:MAG: NUDIX hydrolase [Candidatus Omnitrophica bacterium]|nr:NUDIX hydrolase [Candidatus Omnitrophota bacterium]